eukprot:10249834-Alexandrium_andersonii.AAC.1
MHRTTLRTRQFDRAHNHNDSAGSRGQGGRWNAWPWARNAPATRRKGEIRAAKPGDLTRRRRSRAREAR